MSVREGFEGSPSKDGQRKRETNLMERCGLPRGGALLAQLTFSPHARAKQQCISFVCSPECLISSILPLRRGG